MKSVFEVPLARTVDLEDVVETRDFGRVGNVALAGHGKVTGPKCHGGLTQVYGCINVAGHNITTLDGVNHAGKAFLRHVVFSCDKLSCPACYRKAAWREARNAEFILKEASKRLELPVEHAVVSFPKSMYEWPEERLRAYAREGLRVRGCFGGCMIWHPFRFHKKIPYLSPHFHYDGFVKGGYTCRECEHLRWSGKRWYCSAPKGSCGGFEQVTRKFNEADELIVKIAEERGTHLKGERRSVAGTIRYELGHCGIDLARERFHPLTWFGVCSYRKLKLGRYKAPKNVCPLCLHELEELVCVGDEAMRKRCYGLLPESPDFGKGWEEDYLDERGVPNFIVKERVYGSGGYA